MNPEGPPDMCGSARAKRFGIAVWLLCTLGPTPASADALTPDLPSRLGRHLLVSPWLLGDVGGLRQRLELNGLSLQLYYNQFVGWKPSGGAVSEATWGHSGSYDFFTLVDMEALASWPGLLVLLHARGLYDRNINRDVGALSDPIDDADFDDAILLDELWLEQALLRDRIRVRLGLLEQQTLYDRNEFANSEDLQFSNSFLDNNPLVPLPNGLGVAFMVAPLDWLELALGVTDAEGRPLGGGLGTAFDGIDAVTGYVELAFELALPSRNGSLPGTYRIGGFIDGRAKPDFDTGVVTRGHGGVYLSLDQMVWRERAAADDGLGLFARLGWSEPQTSRTAWFWSLGGRYLGALPRRDEDVLALGFYGTVASGVYRREIDAAFGQETGIELYYRMTLLPWLAVTPNFQYIFNPGATGALDDAVVAVVRFRVTF